MQRNHALIAYDIRVDERRRRVHRYLRQWGCNAQYSVFECQLTRKEAETLLEELKQRMCEAEDSVLLMWLDPQRTTRTVTAQLQHTPCQTHLLYTG